MSACTTVFPKRPVFTKPPPGLSAAAAAGRAPGGTEPGRTGGPRSPSPSPRLAAAVGLRFGTALIGNAAGGGPRCFGFGKLRRRPFLKRLLLPGTETTRSFHLWYLTAALPQFPPDEKGGNKLLRLGLQLPHPLRLGTKPCWRRAGSGACARAAAASPRSPSIALPVTRICPAQDTNSSRLHPSIPASSQHPGFRESHPDSLKILLLSGVNRVVATLIQFKHRTPRRSSIS